jgi:SMC interacting uncharacterized protein involved in chromosome segregation
MSKSTSESKEFHNESKEIHAVYKQNADRFFEEVEKSITPYHQSITNLQRGYTAAWENMIESAISIQREFATKAGINTSVPAAMVKIVRDTTEELIKVQAVQNKVVLAAIDATQQSINIFNENAKVYSGLNQGVLQYWILACIPTRN